MNSLIMRKIIAFAIAITITVAMWSSPVVLTESEIDQDSLNRLITLCHFQNKISHNNENK